MSVLTSAKSGLMTRTVVLSGVERRRTWPDALRREIVFEAFRPGAIVSEVARRYDVATSQIYGWRKEMAGTADAPVGQGFVEAIITRELPTDANSLSGGIQVELRCGARVQISAGTSPEMICATLGALR